MKYFIIFILITNTAFATSHYTCEFDSYGGYVYLNSVEKIKNYLIRFNTNLGRESFDQPFQVQNRCSYIASTLNEALKISRTITWWPYGCSNYSSVDILKLKIDLNQFSLYLSPAHSYLGEPEERELYRYGYRDDCDGY